MDRGDPPRDPRRDDADRRGVREGGGRDRRRIAEAVGRAHLRKRVAGRTRSRTLQPSSFGIVFETAIEFLSEDGDWDPKEMVASGFRPPDRREQYLGELRASSGPGSPLENVEGMTMEVDGFVVAGDEVREWRGRVSLLFIVHCAFVFLV